MKTEEKTKQEQIEEEEKAKNIYKSEVWVNKVGVLTKKDNENIITKVILHTDRGNITYKPKKTKRVTREINNIEFTTEESEDYTQTDLFNEYPVLLELSKNCKKEPQLVILAYTEKAFYNTKEKELETYMFMGKWQFELLYYKEFHKDNEEPLLKQIEYTNKLEEREL